jgi:hypothetical protein
MASSSSSELDDDDDDDDDDDGDDATGGEGVERFFEARSDADAGGVQATVAARSSVPLSVWLADAEFVVLQLVLVVVVVLVAPFAVGVLVLVVFAAGVEDSFFDLSLLSTARERSVVVTLRGFFFDAVSDAPTPSAASVRFFLPVDDGTDRGEQRSPK